MFLKIYVYMLLSVVYLNDVDENELKVCEVVAYELFVVEDCEEGSGLLDCM